LGVESICWRLGGFLGSRAIIRVGEDIRTDLFEAVSARPWEFYNRQASGALAGRITAAAAVAATVMRTVVWSLVPPVTDLVGSVVVLATIDWRIGGALVVAAGGATLALHRLGLRGFPVHRAYHREADRHLQCIAEHGRAGWQKASGYTAQARVGAAIGRFKQVIGDGLRSRTDQRRPTEVDVAAHALNRMLELGRPISVRIA